MRKTQRKRSTGGSASRGAVPLPPRVPPEKRSRGALRWLVPAAGLTLLGGIGIWTISNLLDTGNHFTTEKEPAENRGRASKPVGFEADAAKNDAARAESIVAPGLSQGRFVSPLADAYRRIDPANDGWQTEAFNEAAGDQLKQLAKLLEHPEEISNQQLNRLAADTFTCPALRPGTLVEVFRDDSLRVQRSNGTVQESDAAEFQGPDGLREAASRFARLFSAGIDRVKFKLFKVESTGGRTATTLFFHAFGSIDDGALQCNATWKVDWEIESGAAPRLKGIQVRQYEEVVHHGTPGVMFADCTEAVLGDTDCYREQFLYATDHWRARIARDLGLDVVANHGLAVGDVNGDELDDLYICQQGGLPNRLLIQNADGTLRDASADSGADWLDYCASALLVDLDNDGDRDLVVAQEWRILLMSNDGGGRFQLEFGIGSRAQSFSLTAADYDTDGDLDVYVCGYNPPISVLRRGAMGEPVPYHDANNGGRNILLRNEGGWLFNDVTLSVGLEENNTRYSFAAAWEDFDNDGDQDLYVANDYGRNNLYRNDGGRFVDVAATLEVEDMSAGMSASWADFNCDGWMDLYVSNMFSAAGNRITYQRQFKTASDENVRRQFQRHARGNTLFENTGGGPFRDVSQQAAVTMGRWAWGSKFVDLNGDGWEDIVVANGFITTDDTRDL